MRDIERKVETMPVLITKADVLDHLAGMCANMASGLKMASLIVDLPLPSNGGYSDLIAAWKSKLPAPDLQIAAANDAGKLLRQLAAEERILAARAAANQTNKEPSRG
ncbi:hypothetical protein [Sphingomonas parapaucimobilis]|uniref:Uncharacterized protein n=1 Tax=Sphingomonas parapaucimobilis NBRC 15100 TaxID=1219049 RepID=A0A0A1W515_9SPHN|nr:hypothetical protein [Sphingomonas parapaucimobilis]GAM00530.1 hypothetical protein SP5_034_01040 [Sphingomonas parapaucimobilis NBRC 15100]